MIRFIVGLGNPGEKYRNSPHNLGRALVESLQKKMRLKTIQGKWFDHTEVEPSYVLLNTYMNVSGEAVKKLISQFHCSPGEILICYDDFDIPMGKIRIRKKGSAGSHNGLKSIIEHTASTEFPRMRLGIGPLSKGANAAEFVLTSFSKEQEKTVKEMMGKAEQAIRIILAEGTESAMNLFN